MFLFLSSIFMHPSTKIPRALRKGNARGGLFNYSRTFTSYSVLIASSVSPRASIVVLLMEQ